MSSLAQPVVFHLMIKPYGPICNLNCTYCYYLEKKKLYPGTTDFRMPDEVLEEFIRQYIESQDVPTVTFGWQGGEPTLSGIDFFSRAIAFQKKYSHGKKIENTFQSNGILLDADWCKFLHDNRFLVGISIDGPAENHNRRRVTKDGRPTFDNVLSSIDLLIKYRVEFNTLTVVGPHNVNQPMEVYHFLKSIGSRFIQFLPVVERTNRNSKEEDLKLAGPEYDINADVTEWSVNPADYGRFLIDVFDEWVRHDVSRYYVQLFDVTLANWVGEPPGLCIFDEICGNALALEHNGDLFSCDHFVYPKNLLGNIRYTKIKDLAQSAQQFEFGQQKLQKLPAYCIQCEYRFACHGECPKHRFCLTPDGEPGLNYLCEAYKMFFSYVHPFMQFMGDELAAKRPPANVMKWARQYKTFSEGYRD